VKIYDQADNELSFSIIPAPTIFQSSYEIQLDNTVNKVKFILPNYQVIETEINGSANLDITFVPFQLYNVFSGNVNDIFNKPLRNVKTKLTISSEITFDGQVSNGAGEYAILIPNNYASSGEILFYLDDNFEETKVSLTRFGKYAEINVRLYGKENFFQLITGEGKIRMDFDVNISTLSLTRDIRTQHFDRYSPTLKRGFIQLALKKADFLHKEYQKALIMYAVGAANAKANDSDNDNEPFLDDKGNPRVPNPPYTPATNSISLDYVSTQILELGRNDIDSYFHLFPFEGEKAIYVEKDKTQPLIDPYHSSDIPTIIEKGDAAGTVVTDCAHGNLYIGLENLIPGGNLSLLFQTKEGTEASFDDLPPDLKWSYLAKDNQWVPFAVNQVLKDTTFGLTRTGVVQLQIPFTAVRENTVLTDGLYWIRVAAIENVVLGDAGNPGGPSYTVQALPSLVAIKAQVIEVRFVPDETDAAHQVQPKPLVEGTIKKLARSNARIKKIKQPFPSFNGRFAEAGNDFYQRVSERLRHRDRAVTVWDYQRLLLERFPKVYRAKTLRHSNLISELQPGHVLVAVIPDLKEKDLDFPIQPRFSRGDLAEMVAFLRTKTNFFVARNAAADGPYLRVENPIYEPVQVFLDVLFKADFDVTFYHLELDKAIKQYIAPWAYDPTKDISFQRHIDKSHLFQFLEGLPYIEAILDFGIEHCNEEVTASFIVPHTSRSILTTFTSKTKDFDHDICVITDLANYDKDNPTIEIRMNQDNS